MSGYVIKIPQEKENRTIWSRQLRVAAYCRVSTPYEEQQKSLEKQIKYFTQYIKRNVTDFSYIHFFITLYGAGHACSVSSSKKSSKRPYDIFRGQNY